MRMKQAMDHETSTAEYVSKSRSRRKVDRAELAVEREAEIAVPLDAVPLTSDQTHDELTEMVYSVPLMA